ncbi:hypothetical protein [Salmonirosea aquatica]|uniref:Uncharacterized protein n=1 Tax=Salmonirosea aquatica TaxID=2654236 RepID=A0A7C9FBC6_9BACT|nr:hypothetical protein [Cytophagaceae bacterium SJW1-29]
MQLPIQSPRTNLIAAIDPDLHKLGLAVWDRARKIWRCHTSIANDEVKDFLSNHFDKPELTIYIEAGWKHKKANFRGGHGAAAHSIARNVGENHAMGKFISGQLQKAGFTVIEIPPLEKKHIKVEGKWTPMGRRYVRDATGIHSPINDDVRDALMIVLHFR